MFNLEDTKTIMNIINQRDTDKMLFPVCVKIDQNYYYIPTLDQLDIVGSNIKIATELNWKPTIDIKDTIKDMIAERL